MSRIKVAMCWDDGVTTDIHLISIVRKYNAKATFNLNPGLMPQYTEPNAWATPGENRWSHQGFMPGKVGLHDLLAIYGDFAVASHCNRHESAGFCPNQAFLESAVGAKKFLEDTFQHECPGFAWPCGRYTAETVEMLRQNGFRYGRTTEYAEDITTCTEPLTLPANCKFNDREFYAKYEKAKACGVFYFWGHSYETFDYEPLWRQLEDKIAYISNDPDAEWCDVIDLVPLLHK